MGNKGTLSGAKLALFLEPAQDLFLLGEDLLLL